MNDRLWKKLNNKIAKKLYAPVQERWYGRHQRLYDLDLTFSEAVSRYPERNALYAYMHHYFVHRLPQGIKDHRTYFKQNLRGFGEDAFHAMWWLLLREYRPGCCLEIGVYRGQVISLWTMTAKYLDFPCKVNGISPFTPIGDGVSVYREDVDYLTDTKKSFEFFRLPAPALVKALSTDAEAMAHVASHKWNLIYIDGCHDFDISLKDYRLCREYLASGGLLVLDDASLGTSFRPPLFSFAGHPGSSRVAAEFAMKEMKYVGAVGHNNIFQKN